MEIFWQFSPTGINNRVDQEEDELKWGGALEWYSIKGKKFEMLWTIQVVKSMGKMRMLRWIHKEARRVAVNFMNIFLRSYE